MKDYDEIRKRYLSGESQRHIAKTLGISRNTVSKYCEGAAVPWVRKTPERRSTVLTDDTIAFIQACLSEGEEERPEETEAHGQAHLRPPGRRDRIHRW
ncbi:hypothetical protein GCWU000341_00005 [Oribacterium sp. oral taxon 078 str. F0262]|nr:hypothetical protein GCWU000341_00005 [Oribacterium sp. oral taxon 078 str. F0262]